MIRSFTGVAMSNGNQFERLFKLQTSVSRLVMEGKRSPETVCAALQQILQTRAPQVIHLPVLRTRISLSIVAPEKPTFDTGCNLTLAKVMTPLIKLGLYIQDSRFLVLGDILWRRWDEMLLEALEYSHGMCTMEQVTLVLTSLGVKPIYAREGITHAGYMEERNASDFLDLFIEDVSDFIPQLPTRYEQVGTTWYKISFCFKCRLPYKARQDEIRGMCPDCYGRTPEGQTRGRGRQAEGRSWRAGSRSDFQYHGEGHHG
ncbi:MAG: hypothetical protein M3Q73_04010 [bacterium]|nr:hypothetical protein [bacterium]